VSKKWNLVNDFTDYEHSSASFYERGLKRYEKIVYANDALSGKIPGSLPPQGRERRPRADIENSKKQF
jgi:hypothetical protein